MIFLCDITDMTILILYLDIFSITCKNYYVVINAIKNFSNNAILCYVCIFHYLLVFIMGQG